MPPTKIPGKSRNAKYGVRRKWPTGADEAGQKLRVATYARKEMEKMKKVVMYNRGVPAGEEDLILDVKNITEKVSLAGDLFYILGLPMDDATEERLRELAPEVSRCDECEEVQEILAREFPGADVSVEYAPDSVPENAAAYILPRHISSFAGYALTPADCETESVYLFWDGSNWEEIWLSRHTTEIVYDDDNGENLDQWNGSNWSYNKKFSHGRIYPVVSVDGEAPGAATYLLYTWSQYQGDIPRGRLLTDADRQEILDGLRK
jgi:hypothetical protein